MVMLLSRVWLGVGDMDEVESLRYGTTGLGVNARRRMMNFNHQRMLDELFVSLFILHEIVAEAVNLEHLRLEVDRSTLPDNARPLTFDQAKFDSVTERMRSEGWVGTLKHIQQYNSTRASFTRRFYRGIFLA